MKILHTSDWHLGHTLYSYDRSREQQAFLSQLANIVAEEQPDALVVSGDIYHYSAPAATTQRMYTDAMLEIHRAYPEMVIAVTAGNHDSCSKLEIDSSLWHHFGVKVIGNIERTKEEVNLEKHLIEVRNEGTLKGYIVAVPHVYPQNFPMLDTETPREQRQAQFFQTLLDEVEKVNTQHLPVVLMAHLSIEGSDRSGHDESIGGIEYVPLAAMGNGYDYLALGHIHCPQNIKGSNQWARYCGTPLPVSFDESYPHSVSVVEISKGEEPDIRTIEIKNLMPLITLPRNPIAFEDALKLIEEYPEETPAYIRLNVSIKDYLTPDCNERASNATKGKACKFCYIKSSREQTTADHQSRHISIQEMQEMSPLEIAKLYYQEAEGEEMDEELCGLMENIVQRTQTTTNKQ